MDPITAAIIAAAPAIASNLVTSVVKDAYTAVKDVIRRKWGENSNLEQAIIAVEKPSASKEKEKVLEQEIAAAHALSDVDLRTAVQKLVETLTNEGVGGKELENIKIIISGGSVQGVVGAHDVKVGTLNFGSPAPGKS